ncbi:hypothetical protein [Desulfosporosinus shakirovi]|uniref:hypothetical protein n=1 Tax=Desulfosporosinus shakirovi TaxID=2885154 RepID=UPI001E352E5A|nr:hypothetical protein [Desulfosporosinus sp. SRJS8]MCB8815400.1 hypothetical protein [Desulfosporosinus sp. SRJS8]
MAKSNQYIAEEKYQIIKAYEDDDTILCLPLHSTRFCHFAYRRRHSLRKDNNPASYLNFCCYRLLAAYSTHQKTLYPVEDIG